MRFNLWMLIKTGLFILFATLNFNAIGEQLDFDYCTVCHGSNANGNRAVEAPKLSGMEKWYLESQLRAFNAGYRGTHPQDAPGLDMRSAARTLTEDSEIKAASTYITSLKSQSPATTIQGDKNKGKALYGICSTCHGGMAEGNVALHAPALVQQNDWYLVKQLEDFRTGRRGAHKNDTWGSTMRPMAQTLVNTDAIHDVVTYIKSL